MPRIQFEYKVTVANVIQIALILIGGFWAYATLVSAQAQATTDIGDLKPSVAQLQTTAATFNTRLTVVESRAESTDRRITDLVGSIDKLVTQMSTDRASTEDVARDVSYLRAWVESVKREARQ